MRMAEYFGNSYFGFYNKYLDIGNDQLLMKQFVESQTELFKYIKREIYSRVLGKVGESYAQSVWFASRLIQRARQELFNPRSDKVNPNLRRQLEEQLIRHNESIELRFRNVKVSGISEDFELKIRQSKVLSKDIRFGGYNKKLEEGDVYKNSKPAYMNGFIQDTTDDLELTIKTLTGGKARIFILTDTGDPNLGYQYLVPQTNKEGDIYVEALKSREWLPKGPSYFDIDLTAEDSQDHLIIEHLVKVMLGTTDLIVIKEAEGTWDDGKMVCAFNQYKFFRSNEIYSGPSDNKVYDNYKYYNYQMKITEQTSKVSVRGWFNYMGWSFGGGGSEFHNYLNSIFNDPMNYLNLNNFLIRYTT